MKKSVQKGLCSYLLKFIFILLLLIGCGNDGDGTHTLKVEKSGNGFGTVFGEPEGLYCGDLCSHAYNKDTRIALIPRATHGSVFAGWSEGKCPDSVPCIVKMDKDHLIKAKFDLLPPEPYVNGRITERGVLNVFEEGLQTAEGYPVSCETSAIAYDGANLIMASDNPIPGEGRSPVFSIPYRHDMKGLSSAPIVFFTAPSFVATVKYEGMTVTPDGAYVIATTGFDRIQPDSAEWDTYNMLLIWPAGSPDSVKVVSHSERDGIVSSVSLREKISDALKIPQFPEGVPYFRIEGLAAIPGNRLLFGISELGDSYKIFDYAIKIVSVTYKMENDEMILSDDYEQIYDYDLTRRTDLGHTVATSGIEYDKYHDRLYILTSFEDEEKAGEVTDEGMGGFLWVLPMTNLNSRTPPWLVMRKEGEEDAKPLMFAHKPEGVTPVSENSVILIHDDERVSGREAVKNPETQFSRKLHQAAYSIVELGDDKMKMNTNIRPDFIKGEIIRKKYDGEADDLLTAGLGMSGLAGPAPELDDSANPSAEELRRLAVYNNYRGIVDTSPGGGYGEFYGPGVGFGHDGKIPGTEYITYADDGTGKKNVTLMVQIPDSFDPGNACIVTAPSSGSRGIYGAIATAGEWGLKRGFAVAYTDKGTGVGVHDPDTNTVNLITGERVSADKAGKNSNFTADIASENFHGIAFKHAHSQQNPEKDWGLNVLQSIRFAFYVLNLEENFRHFRKDDSAVPRFTKNNTLVIASSISNGGSASIRAAEQDSDGLIDGIAVSEPNISPKPDESLIIRQGQKEWVYPNHSRSLLDCHTLLNLCQPCANLAPGIRESAPFNMIDAELGKNRCRSLKAAGFLRSETLEAQAVEAQEKINASGILEEQNLLQPALHNFYISEGIAVSYANAYGRFSVRDNLCGFSFSAIDDELKPARASEIGLARIFGAANGIPPTGGVILINNKSQGWPMSSRESVSASSGIRDQNCDGALCLRSLVTGEETSGEPLTGEKLEAHQRVMRGIAEIRASGSLKGIPAVIVHGRSDAVLSPNHTSRAYFGLNRMVDGAKSRLHYYEVTNTHHLDAFNGLPVLSSKYLPLHYCYVQALDLMYDHLRNGTPLPASQVVRTIPRGMDQDGEVLPLARENLPHISPNPDEKDLITLTDGNTVNIPE